MGTWAAASALACSSEPQTENIGEAVQALSATGGSKATGGKSSIGGSKATGGKSSTSGAATGGKVATGGTTALACSPQDCNDHNTCTSDSCNAGTCVHTAVSNGTSCSDGNACNGAETCNGSGTCVPGTPVTCTAPDACHTVGTCNPSTGACSNPSAPDGTACTNNACFQSQQCAVGVCQGGSAVPVDDGDLCTTDTCDSVNGVQHTPVTSDPNCAKWYSGGLKVEVRTNYCDLQKVQQYFQVTNTGASPVNLSDISIKYWVYDTTGANVVSDIYYAGCVVTSPSNLTCEHPVTGVVASGKQPSACVADGNTQANWEVTLTPTDSYALQPGHQWNNVQTVVHLDNWATFTPGTGQWYSTCLTKPGYNADTHFSVYYKGNLVFSSGINAPACAAPHGRQQLSGHLSKALKAAPLVAPVPGNTVISIAVGLPINVPQDGSQNIEDLIRDVSDPKSPNYGNYLDVNGYAAKYGSPSTGAVGDWAKSYGLTVAKTFPNMVSVSGTAAAIAQALYLNMNYYTRPDGTQFYAADREPSLDFDPAVDHISRLDNLFVSKALNGSGFNDGFFHTEGFNAYLGKDFRNAYASCHLSLTGSQQAVGLVGNGFSIADLNEYSQADLGKPVNVNQITAVITNPTYPVCGFPAVTCKDGSQCGPSVTCSALGFGGCCPTEPVATMTTCDVACNAATTGCQSTGSGCPYPSDSETPMDMALVLGMAPNATIVIFEGWHDATMLQAMANHTEMRINQFSSSFPIALDANVTKALKQMASQGQSFFQSSGDSGAIADPGDIRSSDLITTVGGTVLMMTGNGDSWSSESVWNNGGGFYTNGNAHNGAPSIAKPQYQQFIDMTANNRGGDNRYRNVPDVAAVASNAEYFWAPNPTQNAGGTSVSAPVWAGFMALVNEQRSQKDTKSSVGFANPLLYSLAQNDSTYQSGFNDITAGHVGRTSCDPNYTFCFPYDPAGGFQAEPGYDLATGLGSPKCALIDLLQGQIPRHVTVTADVEFQTCECGSCGNPPGGYMGLHAIASGSCDLSNANPTCTIDLSNYQLCAVDLGVFVRSTITLQSDDSVTVCPQDWWADGDGCGRDNWKWSGTGPCTTVAPNANINIDTNGLSAHDSGSCCVTVQPSSSRDA